MYEAYYNFQAKPFQLSPDPSFLFRSQGHRRAMAYLVYGVNQGEGFIVITGEIGAGKTMLASTLARNMTSRTLVLAQVVNTSLEADDLVLGVRADDLVDEVGDVHVAAQQVGVLARAAAAVVDVVLPERHLDLPAGAHASLAVDGVDCP